MFKSRTKFLLLLSPLFWHLLAGCCGCPESTYYSYSIEDLSVNNLDNSGSSPIESSAAEIESEVYALRAILQTEEISKTVQTKSRNFGNPLVFDACDECSDELVSVSEDSIVSIRIINLNKFDAAHPANSDISGYFRVLSTRDPQDFRQYEPIDDFLRELYPLDVSDLDSYPSLFDGRWNIVIDFFLLQNPETPGEQQFKVEITLSGGDVLTATTPIVSLI